MTSNLRKFSILVALAVLVVDLATKYLAISALSGEPPKDFIGSLRWNLHFNSGSAFSRGQGLGRWIALLVIVVVVLLARSEVATFSRRHAAATGMILGGAVGNLADRIFRANEGLLTGSVVDFIDFQFWPIFNFADAAIVCGVMAIIGLETFSSSSEHD